MLEKQTCVYDTVFHHVFGAQSQNVMGIHLQLRILGKIREFGYDINMHIAWIKW